MIKEFLKYSNDQLSDNFWTEEFKCHCSYIDCHITYVDTDLVGKLQELRSHLGIPIKITSGYRCARHNKDIGGKKGSYHLIGKAADISVDVPLVELQELCEERFDGVGRYPGRHFTHVDIRGYKAKWTG